MQTSPPPGFSCRDWYAPEACFTIKKQKGRLQFLLSLAKTLSDEAGQERRVCRAGVVRSSNGGPSGEGAERIFASRRESTRSTPPVEPEVFDP
jgi:hypothetical protein